VALKYEGLDQWEIWVSESQERMTVAVKPEHLERFMALSALHAVESTVIGEYNDSGYLHLDFRGETCAHVKMDLLNSDFPQWEFEAEWTPPEMRGLHEPVLGEPEHHGALLKSLLSRPNICARNWIARQYDHEVQGGSVIKPLVGKSHDVPSDAAVIRPVLESLGGLVVSQAINPFYSLIDTYHMTAATIDEAVRKTLAVGGDPEHLGGVDNFCWPTIEYDPEKNPDGKYKAAQLVRSNWALKDTCLSFGIPLLSGKDSMYVDGNLKGPFGERRKISGLPTLLFTVCSVIRDVTRCVTLEPKCSGDDLYVLGLTRNELGGSEYYALMGSVGLNVPRVEIPMVLPLYKALHQAIEEGLISSCHAVSRGGLAVHLALVAMAGETGMDIHLPRVPGTSDLSPAQILYAESCGRFVVTLAPENRARFEKVFSGLNAARVGRVSETSRFRIHDGESGFLIDEEVSELKKAWQKPFGDLI
jgi:phosphoribosylformylglycinamidine synthase